MLAQGTYLATSLEIIDNGGKINYPVFWPLELTGVISLTLRLESLETPDLKHPIALQLFFISP